MMNSIVKQCVGIDCSKDDLVTGYGKLDSNLNQSLTSPESFANTPDGIDQLIGWANQYVHPGLDCLFIVEATGVYHQQLAWQLHERGYSVCVVLANKVRHFTKTLKVRTQTDRTACRAITRMGLEKNLDRWHPPHPVFNKLKQLTRERTRLKNELTMLTNQRHAAEVSIETLPGARQRVDERIELCQRHIQQIEDELRQIIDNDDQITQRFDYVCSIHGVGWITAATILGETNGFNLIRNARQLVCYAGYDVVEKTSGTSVRGTPRISKNGNAYIRRALYFPAITSVKKSSDLSTFYERLYQRHSIKMKAYTAVQRKLLILIYTLWKNQQVYDPEYGTEKVGRPEKTALRELA